MGSAGSYSTDWALSSGFRSQEAGLGKEGGSLRPGSFIHSFIHSSAFTKGCSLASVPTLTSLLVPRLCVVPPPQIRDSILKPLFQVWIVQLLFQITTVLRYSQGCKAATCLCRIRWPGRGLTSRGAAAAWERLVSDWKAERAVEGLGWGSVSAGCKQEDQEGSRWALGRDILEGPREQCPGTA